MNKRETHGAMTKDDIRKLARQRRKELNQMWVELKSIEAQRRLMELTQFRKSEVVCCYLAMEYEVKTDRILEACWRSGRTVCVPAYDRKAGVYKLTVFRKDDPVIEGKWRVWEPTHKEWLPIVKVDMIVIPGLAFDSHGGRLGHGGGHYDTMLGRGADTVRAFKAGLGFDFQMFSSVPMGSKDVWLDVVVTEKALHRAGSAM